jgi:hypothetical protein
MHVAVEVHEVRVDAVGELEQPLARPLHVVPRVVHPLEAEVALEQLEAGHRRCRLTLVCRGTRPMVAIVAATPYGASPAASCRA